MLKGEKVTLRKITKEDTDNIVKWRNSEGVQKNFFDQDLLTPEIHTWWLENRVETGQVAQFIIVDNETGKDIGTTFIRDIDYKNKKGEYGIFIGEVIAKGKGLGTEAGKLTLEYAFNELKLHKVFCRVFTENKGAIKADLKAGFIQEGLLKEDIFVDNQFKDILIMAIFNTEKEVD